MKNDSNKIIKEFTHKEYKYGFVSNIEMEIFPKGISEDIIKKISQIKRRTRFHARISTESL